MTEQTMTDETTETDVAAGPSADEAVEEIDTPTEDAQRPDDGQGDDEQDEPDVFPREYVVKLRQEAAESRVKAKRADELAERLHVALVAGTGRMADPTDLPFDAAHLDDETALTAAIDALLARKPHLAARRPMGNVGQGVSAPSADVDLAGMLRARS